jgi:DNA-directed RNA polymerase
MSVDQTVKYTIPIQLDMKNNAIQHIATICNDEEVMKIVGVIPSEANQIDLYETVAAKLYNKYIAHKGQP